MCFAPLQPPETHVDEGAIAAMAHDLTVENPVVMRLHDIERAMGYPNLTVLQLLDLVAADMVRAERRMAQWP